MLVLAFVWLALLLLELVWGGSSLFESLGLVIWGVLAVNFAIEVTLAPDKLAYRSGTKVAKESIRGAHAPQCQQSPRLHDLCH